MKKSIALMLFTLLCVGMASNAMACPGICETASCSTTQSTAAGGAAKENTDEAQAEASNPDRSYVSVEQIEKIHEMGNSLFEKNSKKKIAENYTEVYEKMLAVNPEKAVAFAAAWEKNGADGAYEFLFGGR